MFEKRKLLFVEDDNQEIESISKLLHLQKIEFVLATTVGEAVNAISKQAFDFLLTDLHIETRAGFERPDGLLVIKAAKENQPNITIVATSSDPRSEIWNEALSAGAHQFIRKPISKGDEIEIAFGLARERKVLLSVSDKASNPRKPIGRWKKYADGYPYGIVIGDRELKLARNVAKKRDSSVVITGETGTGKEEVAKLIHRLRVEAEGSIPFVAVNCATVSGNLVESQLFGHRKGAFTGAEVSTTGLIGEADGGILFLDEIQTLDIPTQQKLLRVLNDGTYNRVGETKVHRSQFQLIAASTKDLDDEVAQGRFLVDIRTRMMGLDFNLKPLRERWQDIPALIALYLSKEGISIDDTAFDDLVKSLQTFHWAGNIRQLFKALGIWKETCDLDELPLIAEHFPIFKGMQVSNQPRKYDDMSNDLFAAVNQDVNIDELMMQFEKLVIANAMKRHGTISEACRSIGLPRSTFDTKRKRLGLT